MLSFILCLACGEQEPAPLLEPEAVAEPEGPPSAHEVHPEAAQRESLFGSVRSGGQPVKGAWMKVESEGEELPLVDDGDYLLHMYEDRYGPNPHVLEFGAPGYATQRFEGVEILPEGTRLDVELVKE